MSKTTHTPGPWAVSESSTRTVWKDGISPDQNFMIASCKCYPAKVLTQKEERANARLIASAPDLLNACRDMREDARLYLSGDLEPSIRGWKDTIDYLDGVIAKAESPSAS
jgi:hypothetical protein